jgi:predicted dehydrogenase
VSELESGELRITIDGTEKPEQIQGKTTYDHQLEAFVSAVLDGEPQPTGGPDAIANMRAIDGIYSAAGMEVRGVGK